MTEYFTLASLLLTPGVLLGCALVLSHWGGASIKALRDPFNMGPQDWLIVGVVIGFLGAFVDNSYWAVAWHLDYIGSPHRDWWFTHGSVSNVFARQLAGLLSGLCHVISAYMLVKSRTAPRVTAILLAIMALGGVYAVILLRGIGLPPSGLHGALIFSQVAIPVQYVWFAGQVLWFAGHLSSIDRKRMWTGIRIATVFTLCSGAGYISHLFGQVQHPSLPMVAIHLAVVAVMARVNWKGRDARRVAGMMEAK